MGDLVLMDLTKTKTRTSVGKTLSRGRTARRHLPRLAREERSRTWATTAKIWLEWVTRQLYATAGSFFFSGTGWTALCPATA